MKPARYRNPWVATSGPEFFETTVRPTVRGEFQIYHRLASCWDVVKDGVCLTQRAGYRGALAAVQELAVLLARAEERDLVVRMSEFSVDCDQCEEGCRLSCPSLAEFIDEHARCFDEALSAPCTKEHAAPEQVAA